MTTIDKLQELGVTFDHARSGPVETTVTIQSLDQLKDLLDIGLDDQGRSEHYSALYDEAGDGHAHADALVRDIAAYAVGSSSSTASGLQASASVFPLTVNVVADPQPITVSEKKDLSSSDGRPTIVVFSDVTMKPGGYFYCAGTALTFTCDTFTRDDPLGDGHDFEIVGLPGETPPKPPTPGQAGRAGSGGPGECSSAGIAGHGGGKGTAGSPGAKGADGGSGGTGTPSQPTTVWIKNKLAAPQLAVYTQSGPGGRGGDGGDGGLGQPGGNGGKGVTCGCTGNAGGSGAAGGRGGKGGRAGDGGNGAHAVGNITVYVPTLEDVGKLRPVAVGAPPGEPGKAGNGGKGGAGGKGGSGGKGNDGGSDAGAGGPGDPGDQGSRGTVTGEPAKIVALLHP